MSVDTASYYVTLVSDLVAPVTLVKELTPAVELSKQVQVDSPVITSVSYEVKL